ncbi:hypothetical protein NDU88_004880 [Pleurodeles waltl]|uniref:Endonuclease/exonuclease/phosphatase domain-containing protein n=1 Tax=Pleurodeles waltl TaxID=8319 RepID=A0AAV7MUP5_PLEWA|nr:hypothetical protein NDU88_004880 [Pleurodeles waltl]
MSRPLSPWFHNIVKLQRKVESDDSTPQLGRKTFTELLVTKMGFTAAEISYTQRHIPDDVHVGTAVGERQELFQRLRPQLVTSRTIMMGGDFNCILESGGQCGTRAGKGWMDDAAKFLAEMVGEASLIDVIGSMGPDARNFTWSRADGSLRSRIDFVFTSKSGRIKQHSMVTVYFSDHMAIRFQGELTGKFLEGPGTWKLNSSLLGREDLQEELRSTYSEWQDMKDTFQSLVEWWEWAKGRIQDFFKNVGRKAARGRRKEFSRLQQQLQELHNLQLWGWDVMNPVEAVKKELSKHFHDESRKIIFRSKVENLEKGEKCNSFFFRKIHSAQHPSGSTVQQGGNFV